MNNLSTIPFYTSLEQQDSRLWYAYGEHYPLKIPNTYLVPFFFILPYSTDRNIERVYFYQVCDTEGKEALSGDFNLDFNEDFGVYRLSEGFEQAMRDNGFGIRHDAENNIDVLYYLANHNNSLEVPNGLYYMTILLSDMVIYSEVFQVVNNTNGYLKVEWYCQTDMPYEGGLIPYGTFPTFKNILYLDANVGMPEYSITEEGEERSGIFFPTKQISEKTYHFNIVAPEYLCDAMRLIRLADRVKITDQLGRVYQCDTFEMDVNWLEQGHYASVECSFQTNTIVKKIGKAYNNLIER